MDTTTAMGAFVGENFDSVYQLNKEFQDKEQELQRAKQELAQAKEQHREGIQLLKEEYEEKLSGYKYRMIISNNNLRRPIS